MNGTSDHDGDSTGPTINGRSSPAMTAKKMSDMWGENLKNYLEERFRNYVTTTDQEVALLKRTIAQMNMRINYLEGMQQLQNGESIPTIQENHRESEELAAFDGCYSPGPSIPSTPMTPFTSPSRCVFPTLEQQRTGMYDFLQAKPNVDFFRSCASDNDSLDGQSGGKGFIGLPSISKRALPLNVVPESRGGSTSSMVPSGSSNLRRSNSRNSRRNRRMSLPDAFSVNRSGWPVATFSGRPSAGSFVGNGPDDFGDTGADEAFMASDSVPRANMQELEIRRRFGELGHDKGHLNAPHGFCLSANEQEIIIADTNNHRIQAFDQSGTLRWIFGSKGQRDGQLWYPRKVAWLAETRFCSARLVVCDRGQERSRIQIFSYRRGDPYNPLVYMHTIPVDYVAIVAGMTVYKNRVLIVDSVHPACLAFEPSGFVTFWFDCSAHMKEPSDIVVANDNFYICDFKGHCVCVYNGKGEFCSRIGDHSVINFPNGISVGLNGNVYVGDSHGNRFHVAVYGSNGDFLHECECPHMKVSRCCGLVLTLEGCIVTIAKNNNFILILAPIDRQGMARDRGIEMMPDNLQELIGPF